MTKDERYKLIKIISEKLYIKEEMKKEQQKRFTRPVKRDIMDSMNGFGANS